MASKSEEVLCNKFDSCLADATVKVGAGLTIGAVSSLLLFKRKMWPITFGIGSGFGMSYSDCEHELNNSNYIHISKLKKAE
ncbi:MICOS complex subunit MIC10 [Eurytemora carolleeae]|uniref:MICOS complex subunit MIC10 n=1 Tax=Eurytemora carolleeae TaxID=1294199 RepID=UPI000C76EFDB|nr:MICOS complex subunit MIC10 [Eurytemora carolleeae]|eukprot:XP_023327552.1 MICOS complex subunit MIC10-like [Eurytemora affinis]